MYARQRKRKLPKGMENALPNVSMEELQASQKAAKAMPTWGEIKSAFGEEAVQTKKINLDSATREGRENRGKLLDMMLPAWAAEAHRGQVFGDKIEKEAVKDDRGRTYTFPKEVVDNVARQHGFHSSSGLHFGPPRGGWPVFDKDGKVIG